MIRNDKMPPQRCLMQAPHSADDSAAALGDAVPRRSCVPGSARGAGAKGGPTGATSVRAPHTPAQGHPRAGAVNVRSNPLRDPSWRYVLGAVALALAGCAATQGGGVESSVTKPRQGAARVIGHQCDDKGGVAAVVLEITEPGVVGIRWDNAAVCGPAT